MLYKQVQDSRANPNETRDVKYLHKARYMLFMMGLFSMFCGFIYNDLFSISLNFSNSCYVNKI
jgi:hypothetical protein